MHQDRLTANGHAQNAGTVKRVGDPAEEVFQTCIQGCRQTDIVFKSKKKVIIVELSELTSFIMEGFKDCVFLSQVEDIGCE